MNIIFLSSISFNKTSGKIYLKQEEKIFEINYNKDFSNIEKIFQNFLDNNIRIFVTDTKKIFQNLNFLNSNILSKINFFDCKLFLSVYKNLLNIDIYQYAFENYNINSFYINEKIKNIWKIQNIKSWKLLPKDIVEDFLLNDIEICEKFYKEFNSIFCSENSLLKYYNQSLENLYYLVQLENNGLQSNKNKLVIPKYHYDKILTGRLSNTYPKSFQTISKTKFFNEYKSRFENGKILIADWSNIDFRVAVALSKTKIEDKELEDPYIYLAKQILNKDKIEITERDIFKRKVLTILYGKYYKDEILFTKYPNIFKLKRDKIKEAKKKKYIQSYFGKIRFFDKDDDLDTKAFSSYVQMATADLCKIAIKELLIEFKEKKYKSIPIPFIVYDSFSIDYSPEDDIDDIKKSLNFSLIEKTIPNEFKQYINFSLNIS